LLVHRLREDGTDSAGELRLAAAHLAAQNHERGPVAQAFCKPQALGVVLPQPRRKAFRLEDPEQVVQERGLLGIDPHQAIVFRLESRHRMLGFVELDRVHGHVPSLLRTKP
jgi:hypothetical protein